MNRKALSKAIKLLRIHDVFVVESKYWVRDEVMKESMPMLSIQLRHAIQAPIMFRKIETEGKEQFFMRRFVDAGIRFVESGEEDTGNNRAEPKVFAEVNAKFASEYLVLSNDEPSEELLNAFEQNVVFHVWPYWRELIQSSLTRMRMPPIAIPMFSLNIPVSKPTGSPKEDQISESTAQSI